MQTPANHLPHLLLFVHAVERLRGASAGPRDPAALSIPPELFLFREEGDAFWELVGLGVRGLPSLLLCGLRFRRQSAEPSDLSRESLVSYLSSHMREVRPEQAPAPPQLLEVVVPDTQQPVLRSLKAYRKGTELPRLLVDRNDILFGFDFRLDNPSRSHRREMAGRGAEDRYLFRTTAGHVLSAQPHRLPSKLHREDRFLALTLPTQHTATRDHPLPTLVVHRDFLAAAARLEKDATRWLHHTLPFHTSLATAAHLLDPDLETYRLYRHRESREAREPASAAAPAARRAAVGGS